jgi:hypothetical protein
MMGKPKKPDALQGTLELRRLRGTILGSNLDEDFAEEMQFHLDERIDEYRAGSCRCDHG